LIVMRRAYALLPIVVAAAACHSAASSERSPADKTEPPLSVQLAPVEKRALPRYLTLTGSLSGERHSELAANVSGRVVATYVERGQPVKQGQIVAVVDGAAAKLSAAAAAAQLEAAETQRGLAAAECDRADKLFRSGALNQSDYDRLKAQCSAQKSSAEAARANAGVAAKLAGDAAIRAPFDGIVGERYVSVGEYVLPSTRVVSVYTVDPVRVSISVPEAEVGHVVPGQPVEVNVAAFDERAFAGVVRYVAPALRPQTRDLIVEAVVPNREGLLKPGMFASVRLQVGTDELPTVPLSALRVDDTVKRIFVARAKRAVELVVKTGATRDRRVALLEDLEPGAQVIVDPPASLRDGAALQ
jgi:membrane fusion protein (multidrug efflux system)